LTCAIAQRTALSRRLHRFCCLYLFAFSAVAVAQESVDQTDVLCPPGYKLQIPKPDKATLQDPRIHIDADSATVDSQAVTHFSGSVVIHQADKQLRADQVTFNRNNNQLDAQGNIVFTTGEIQVKGDQAHFNTQTNQGKVDNADYQTGTVNGRGKAKAINVESKTKLNLEDATYTTCPRDHVAWQLRADKIDLNNENHQGTAKSVVLDIGHVPVLYLPYLRFPIGDDRMSGFLYPAISVSQSSGTEIATPYYLNIAPNMDATITPHNMSKRGLMLENEFRYLTDNGKGQIELDHIGQDTLYGSSRTKFDWTHQDNPGAGWSSAVDYHYVSDLDYLNDFSGTLTSAATTTTLNRQGTLSYNQSLYVFTASIQDHQTISGTEPYQRLPQLTFNTRLGNVDNSWNYDFNSEFVNFDHRDPTMVVGQRVKLNPYLAYPIVGDAGFFKPKLTLNYLQYNLDRVSSTQPKQPDVSVPVFSLDTGIYLERDTSIGNSKLLQTLEPRLFYLYAPYRDQSMLPVFDTALSTFSQTLLFSENRFSGNDRIGDANQVTAAVTTRLYNQDNGAELFNLTLGQIFYFRDREVVLPGQPVDTANRSNYIGAVNFTPNPNWNLNGDWQYNPDTHHTEVGNARLQNRPGPGRVINLEYRFTREQLRTEGVSFTWRIDPRWQILGGSQYDLLNEHRLQNFAGLSYESCCWGIRLVWGERFDKLVNNDPNNPRYEHAIYLEFALKGLSSLGSGKDIDTLLKNGILGYSQ
jgi:LPS-assembly protein